jgi:hypothetical protein
MPNRMQSLLRGAPRDELHALGNDIWAGVFDQEMDMIRCHDVVEQAQTEALLGLGVPALNVLNGSETLTGLLPTSLLPTPVACCLLPTKLPVVSHLKPV